MGRARLSPFSFNALARWTFGVLRLVVIAVGLVFGAQAANFAWDHEVHVTPAQTLLHDLLIAQGFYHHHQAGTLTKRSASEAALIVDAGASLEPGSSGTTFGWPASPMLLPSFALLLWCVWRGVRHSNEHSPTLHYPIPATPPPKFA